ncbi:type II toxin-antitoxin system VapB family antitoxin [Aquibium sp. ELW1220]|uniref:type II toxin-antitoxin system VapB family antitoxin n=1 Tax=Aquibium sp. ELW1220 TaxID=2976766 RepID=UPI0025AF2ECA|nr:type II toxin-antitoxin system VapB family antitoxin [Aquibium sp. ELW1220]MDN2579401.1 type II toxin-antitoxin system VapB family antitoxin [Aquibium sp. ELW1220]
MRTTVTLDDVLLEQAQRFSGIKERSALIEAALKALVEREAARRLVKLGGSQPDLEIPDRRRPAAE